MKFGGFEVGLEELQMGLARRQQGLRGCQKEKQGIIHGYVAPRRPKSKSVTDITDGRTDTLSYKEKN